jgi:hypothetical protein
MPTVAAGVSELRVQGEDGIFRVFYYTVLKSNWPENADRVISSLAVGGTLGARARRASPLQRRGVGAGHARPGALGNKSDGRGTRLKPIVASTPEELAAALGLSAAEAKEWQVQLKLQSGRALREPE